MAPTDRQVQELAEVRAKIVDAARGLFLKHGVESVSLRKIAEAIGYTAPGLYTHFKDKGEILAEMCRQDFAALAKVFNRLAKVSDPVERIYRIGMTYIKFANEHPDHYRLMFMTPQLDKIAPPTADDLATMNDPDQDAYAFLLKTVEEGLAQSAFRKELTDAELLTQTLWAAVHGVASMQITHGECEFFEFRSLERRSRLMCAAILRGLLADPSRMEGIA
jgi:AcrR family transcriptional regulator